MKVKTFVFALLVAFAVSLSAFPALADTEMFFVRHADVDLESKQKPLTEAGKKRAMTLVAAMKSKALTHIIVTDYPRTIDTATPISKERSLDIKVIPYKGKKAIAPMVGALKKMPDGSSVLIVANSGNLFEIMSQMGVEPNDSMPCNSKKCFDRNAFDNIWHVTILGDGVVMNGVKY